MIPLFQFFAVISIIYGSLVALVQTKIKLLLAYSTIAHMGFILLGILQLNVDGISAGIFYLLVYLFLSFSLFSILIYYRFQSNFLFVELDKTIDLFRIYNLIFF